jgi:ribonuclease P protein component
VSLPKAYRLRHRRDFSAVYQSGLRRSTHNLTLRALRLKGKDAGKGTKPNGSSDTSSDLTTLSSLMASPASNAPSYSVPTKVGISISQKVSKRAVVRNRIKRQLKAILRQFLPQIAPGWQIVIVVRPSATQCDYEQFLQELKQLLRSAEVINEH